SKDLWRAGFLVCPDKCAPDSPWVNCQCQCDTDSFKDWSPYEV
ncbi:unnamed protein product, partial [Discosporangium mesarthrocarpum]